MVKKTVEDLDSEVLILKNLNNDENQKPCENGKMEESKHVEAIHEFKTVNISEHHDTSEDQDPDKNIDKID